MTRIEETTYTLPPAILRAYFAGCALTGLLSGPRGSSDYPSNAVKARLAADAMLAELAKEQSDANS